MPTLVDRPRGYVTPVLCRSAISFDLVLEDFTGQQFFRIIGPFRLALLVFGS